ncbi:MAG: ATP synthase F1 subunit gamma [Clostridia bacterium]|nr:ATP synthase F1 subunit gamma [Clostridia bacterium]
MNNLNELNQHYRAVQQTRQITNAMYLLATAELKNEIQNMDFVLAYMKRLRGTMKDILSKMKNNGLMNPLISEQGRGHTLFVAVTADKGMCGSYNSDVIKKVVEQMKMVDRPILCSLCDVGSRMFWNKGYEPDYEWRDVLQHPSIHLTKQISDMIIELYLKHEVNEAYVIYTEYSSSSDQQVVVRRFLPLLRRDFLDLEYEWNYTTQPLFEPSVAEVFDYIVPHYLTYFLYDILLQAQSSEDSARMTAMQKATENADEMLKKLSLQISAVRQMNITNEITEIAAAGELSGAV